MNGTHPCTVRDWKSLEFHEGATVAPPMSDDELIALGNSIATTRLYHPIVLYRGKIIDGRSRWQAMIRVGYEPPPQAFVEWDGEENLADLLDALNARRRMMDAGQRAAYAAEIKKILSLEIREQKVARKSAGPSSTETYSYKRPMRDAATEAAETMKVGRTTVFLAERLMDADPAAFEEVKAGRKKLGTAAREAGLTPGRHKVAAQPGGKPLIDRYVPEAPTRLEDIAEEMAEREAIRDQDSDEAWVESLTLYGQLAGKQRDNFVRQAIMVRKFWQKGRSDLAKVIAEIVPGNRKPDGYFYYFGRGLKQAPPDQWTLCPEDEGGCGGVGTQQDIGDSYECPMCHGAGYRIG